MRKTKLFAPIGATAASVHGIEYTVVDGTIHIDSAHVDPLLAHGFARAPRGRPPNPKPSTDREEP